MSRGVPVLLALTCLVAAGQAHADDVDQAKARFRRAVDLYRQQRWSEAADEFEAAYRTKPHGTIHYNVAQCRERLEEWPAAFRAYSDYLREVPDAKDRAAVRTAMRKIEDRLAKVGTQVLLVYSDPPGARVTLDGVDRGKTPLHLVLPPGGYALALRVDGHEPAAERVAMSASASTVVELALERSTAPLLPAQPGAGHAAAAGAVAGAARATRREHGENLGAGHGATGATGHGAPGAPGHGAPASPAPDLTARPPPEGTAPLLAAPAAPRSRMLPVWIAAGTAVAAVAAGIWFGASARSDEQALASMTTPNGSEASQLAQSARTKARTANVLFGVAGGAAVAAGALYVLEAKF